MPKDTDAMLSDAPNCPIRNVLDKVSSKWSMLVLVALSDRKLRFMELKRLKQTVANRGQPRSGAAGRMPVAPRNRRGLVAC